MTKEMEKLNKQVLYSDKTSYEAKRDALQDMWDNKVKHLLFERSVKAIEEIEDILVKEAFMMQKIDLYFKNFMYANDGFKGCELVDIPPDPDSLITSYEKFDSETRTQQRDEEER